MGAMKAYAIELEIRQEEATELGDAALAYRLGMLEACRLISDVRGRYIGQHLASQEPAFDILCRVWDEVFDAVKYLGEANKS